MSERIKAGDILTEAFQFGFYRWVTVFRFALLPIALAMGLVIGAMFLIFDFQSFQALENVQTPTLADFQSLLRVTPSMAVMVGIGAGVVTMFLYCGFFASVYRLVALGEERPGFMQLRFDGPALRVFFALLILNVMNYVVIGGVALAMLAVNGFGFGDFAGTWPHVMSLIEATANDPNYQPTTEQLQQLAPLGAFFSGIFFSLPVIFYLNIKLSPFAPGSASENRLLLFGAFRMTFGHAWSIFGTYVLFFMAVVVMSIIYTLATSFLEMMGALGATLPLIGVIFGIVQFAAMMFYQVFMMGVQLSLQAIIYRRLKTGE